MLGSPPPPHLKSDVVCHYLPLGVSNPCTRTGCNATAATEGVAAQNGWRGGWGSWGRACPRHPFTKASPIVLLFCAFDVTSTSTNPEEIVFRVM